MSVTESDCWLTATTVPVSAARRGGRLAVDGGGQGKGERRQRHSGCRHPENVASGRAGWQADCDVQAGSLSGGASRCRGQPGRAMCVRPKQTRRDDGHARARNGTASLGRRSGRTLSARLRSGRARRYASRTLGGVPKCDVTGRAGAAGVACSPWWPQVPPNAQCHRRLFGAQTSTPVIAEMGWLRRLTVGHEPKSLGLCRSLTCARRRPTRPLRQPDGLRGERAPRTAVRTPCDARVRPWRG